MRTETYAKALAFFCLSFLQNSEAFTNYKQLSTNRSKDVSGSKIVLSSSSYLDTLNNSGNGNQSQSQPANNQRPLNFVEQRYGNDQMAMVPYEEQEMYEEQQRGYGRDGIRRVPGWNGPGDPTDVEYVQGGVPHYRAANAWSNFNVGDQVRVMSGGYSGNVGYIVNVYPDMVKVELNPGRSVLLEKRQIMNMGQNFAQSNQAYNNNGSRSNDGYDRRGENSSSQYRRNNSYGGSYGRGYGGGYGGAYNRGGYGGYGMGWNGYGMGYGGYGGGWGMGYGGYGGGWGMGYGGYGGGYAGGGYGHPMRQGSGYQSSYGSNYWGNGNQWGNPRGYGYSFYNMGQANGFPGYTSTVQSYDIQGNARGPNSRAYGMGHNGYNRFQLPVY